MFWSGRVGRRGAIRPVDRARAPGNGAGSRRVSTGVDERGVRWMRRAHTRARTHPPPAPPGTIHRLQGDRHPFEPWIDESAVRKGRLRLSRLRVVSAARRGGSRAQAGDSLQNFKVGIVSHLLPRPDAVLLHGVAERLLLLIVPVPSERHFEVSRLYCTRLRRRTRASVAGNDAVDVRGLSRGSTVEATVSASRPDRQWAFPPFGRRTPRVFNCRTRAGAKRPHGSISSIDFHRRIIGVSTLANWSEDNCNSH